MKSEGPYHCAAVAEGIDGIIYRLFGPGVETLGADFSQERGARIVAVVANAAHAAGRKAERERCARIADGLLNLEVGDLVGTSIATKIRGGQDGE